MNGRIHAMAQKRLSLPLTSGAEIERVQKIQNHPSPAFALGASAKKSKIFPSIKSAPHRWLKALEGGKCSPTPKGAAKTLNSTPLKAEKCRRI